MESAKHVAEMTSTNSDRTHRNQLVSSWRRMRPTRWLVAPFSMCAVLLSACSSFSLPEIPQKISIPDIEIPENHPSFRRRLYAGLSFGSSSLKPDTRGTVFSVESSSGTASQFRLGMDLHNKFSVELDTGVLGTSRLAQAGTDVSFTSATVSGLLYGFTGVRNRSMRQGWSGYGRLGYSVVQRASQVVPLDFSDNALLFGLGAEYGFASGLALRAEFTRFDSDASVFGLGGIYRFGAPPSEIGQIFVDAAQPVLSSTKTTVDERGRVYSASKVASADRYGRISKKGSALAKSTWKSKPTKKDIDGDGVKNSDDQCPDTSLNTLVNNLGCGMFDAVLSDVTFKPGSSWLTPRARGALDALSSTLLAFPESRVQVRAHTDSDGPADLNLALSVRRAEAVVEYLTSLGVSELQLETRGMGEAQPIDSNEYNEGKLRNRRVDLLTLANIDDQKLEQYAVQSHVLTEAFQLEQVAIDGALEVAALSAPTVSESVAQAATSVASNTASDEPQLGAALPAPLSGVKIEALPKSVYVAGSSLGGIVPNVEFSEKSSNLSPAGKQALTPVVQELSRFSKLKVLIMAHTDDTGNADEELALTQKQARAVATHLESKGIAANRLQAEGRGATLPLAQNVTEQDRARNRRIEVRVVSR